MFRKLLRPLILIVCSVALVMTLTVASSRTASAQTAQQSCTVYGPLICCQWFVWTGPETGWVPLTEPEWYPILLP